MNSLVNKQPWALILGASSGFGEASAIELARAGMNIFGVHMDRRDKLPHVAEVQERIRALGRECEFFNFNAADEDKRKECVETIRQRLADPAGWLRVLLHSLAWGALKPLSGAEIVANKKQIESTADIMGHSLVYWVQECLLAGLFDKGTRIFAMTSSGSTRAIPEYGPVSAAKAILEAHIRQLALELAPAGITANAILAGVTDTAALRLIPGHEKLMEIARLRNPNKRLTTPEDVARCIAALCHPATYWMTGNTLHVDGGEKHCRMISMKPSTDNDLPCLDMLEATPTVLRGLMAELTAEDVRWKPAPDRFSVGEVLAHLSHTEGHCYRARLDRFLAEESPEFESDDAQHHLELYRNMDPEDAFDHFEEQRETNIEALRNLPPGAGERKAVHKKVGPITLAQMLNEWAMHDLGHIRQIAELVRARKYLAGAGPLGAFYQLKP